MTRGDTSEGGDSDSLHGRSSDPPRRPAPNARVNPHRGGGVNPPPGGGPERQRGAGPFPPLGAGPDRPRAAPGPSLRADPDWHRTASPGWPGNAGFERTRGANPRRRSAGTGGGGLSPAGRALARERLLEQIGAARRARTQRTLALVTGVVSALVLLTAGCGWLLAGYVSSHLGRVNAGTAGTPANGPLNILLAGVDVRAGLTKHEERVLHVGHATGRNSDTLMLVHITGDHRHIVVVSLPRDSWVQIPGFGMNKINAAFGLGGPPLMVKTVEHATGLTINEFVEVNFLGFVKIIDALGGVNVCLPYAVDDPYSGLHMSAGRHHVNGIRALQFARDRHSFARSDLARITDQQQLLASVLSEASSSGTLTDPVRFSRFLSAATAATTVDQSFNVTGLAEQMRYIRPGAVSFTTVPLANTNYQAPNGESAVLWNEAAARALFSRVKSDRVGKLRHHHRHRPSPPPGQQTVYQAKSRTAAQAACR
jgi:LCP family protein required for cell wall assembly